MEKMPDGSKVYRNEKQEENLNMKSQIDQLNKYESGAGGDYEDYDRSEPSDTSKQVAQQRNSFGQAPSQTTRRDLTQFLKLRLSDAVPARNANKDSTSKS
jgi:hypothetical protein